MTRSTAAVCVTGARHFSNCREAAGLNLTFDCTLRHEEARTDQRLVTRPIVARRIAEIADCVEQRFAGESSTPGIHVCLFLLDRRRGRRCQSYHLLGQQRRSRNQIAAACRAESRLRYRMCFVNLDREPHVRAAGQRRRTAGESRLIRVAYVAWVKEVICAHHPRYLWPKI